MSLPNEALAVLKRHHPTPLRLREIRQRVGFNGHPKSLGVALQRLQKSGNVKRTGRLWQYVRDTERPLHEPINGLDKGIAPFVDILVANGIETFESCEGGKGHSFPEPTVRFHGSAWAGFRAFSVAMEHGLPVLAVRLAYHEQDGQLAGPHWEMVFRRKATLASAGEAGTATTTQIGVVHEHATAEGGDAQTEGE